MRLWGDGFNHYGSTTHMLDGPYASVGPSCAISTAHPATGTYGLFVNTGNSPGLNNDNAVRKVLPTAIDKMGAMGRFYFDGLPVANVGGTIFDFLTSTPHLSQITCLVDSNGCLRFLRGRSYQSISGFETGTLVAQSDPLVVSRAQNHIEVQVYIHATAGWVRACVNGTNTYEETGLNTLFNTDKIVSVAQSTGVSGAIGAKDFYMGDYALYDFTGDSSVDTDWCPATDGSGIATNFIGDLQAFPLFLNGDTAQADWGKSSGTVGYSLTNEVPPDDSGYIFSTASGNLSEFDLDDLPSTITYIRGLDLHQRLSKSDGGAAMTKAGMKSGTATSDATERPITIEPTYWRDAVDVDPNSSARWTRTSLNAAKYRQTRSA